MRWKIASVELGYYSDHKAPLAIASSVSYSQENGVHGKLHVLRVSKVELLYIAKSISFTKLLYKIVIKHVGDHLEDVHPILS